MRRACVRGVCTEWEGCVTTLKVFTDVSSTRKHQSREHVTNLLSYAMESQPKPRKAEIEAASERYGSDYVIRHARRIATTIASHYGYAEIIADTAPLMVRVYDRKNNKMTTVEMTEVLSLVPIRPSNLRRNSYGQVALSDTVCISANIYACIVAVLATIGIVRET